MAKPFNELRYERLQKLLNEGRTSEFERLAYEWTKTGQFSQRDFSRVLWMKWNQGYTTAQEDESEYE